MWNIILSHMSKLFANNILALNIDKAVYNIILHVLL
jgi:hypothetical protein